MDQLVAHNIELAEKQRLVRVNGIAVVADVDAVCRLMVEQRIPPERQIQLWTDLWYQLPDPNWGEQCIAQAEHIQRLLERSRALKVGPQVGVLQMERSEAALPKRQHFIWLGKEMRIGIDDVRQCIAGLAELNQISRSVEQQNALRCGLGATNNENERTTEAPWVRWLGASDMLWLFINGLWSRGLITCPGGEREKWNTVCGIFINRDGQPFTNTIRNSRCTNKQKIKSMNEKCLGRFDLYVKSSSRQLSTAHSWQ